jgi:hypothetical protein
VYVRMYVRMFAQFRKSNQFVTLICNRGALDMDLRTYARLLNELLDENTSCWGFEQTDDQTM